MKIYLGADHRGFKFKEQVKLILIDEGYSVVDVGAHVYDALDDYVDFAKEVAEKVRTSHDKAMGILFCGSGHGMDMTANRYSNVRCILGFNETVVVQGREHEDANVLSIPAEWVSEEEALKMVKIFINTKFSEKDKYKRRIKKVEEIRT